MEDVFNQQVSISRASLDELQALEEKINQQQAELGRHVQQLQRSSQSVTPEQVVAALDDQSVFVDFLVYLLCVLCFFWGLCAFLAFQRCFLCFLD